MTQRPPPLTGYRIAVMRSSDAPEPATGMAEKMLKDFGAAVCSSHGGAAVDAVLVCGGGDAGTTSVPVVRLLPTPPDLLSLAEAGVLPMLRGPPAGPDGCRTPPHPPGGSVLTAAPAALAAVLGVVAALLHPSSPSPAPIHSAAAACYAAMFPMSLYRKGVFSEERAGLQMLDGGSAPFYRCYQCRDGKFFSVGAIEPQFYKEFARVVGHPEIVQRQSMQASWAADVRLLQAAFLKKTRDQWTEAFNNVEACAWPVLAPNEAPAHPHAVARAAFSPSGMPAPAPRLMSSPARL